MIYEQMTLILQHGNKFDVVSKNNLEKNTFLVCHLSNLEVLQNNVIGIIFQIIYVEFN